jgi:exopolysaccharide biosynthesis polyprenyl glycosylphosphotransferase
MSEQTATGQVTTVAPAQEVRTAQLGLGRRVGTRRSIAARLSVDTGSLLCAAIIVQASAAVPMRAWTLGAGALAVLCSYAAAGLYSNRAHPRITAELLKILSITALVTMAIAAFELAWGRDEVGDTAVRLWLLAVTMTAAGRLALNGARAITQRTAPSSHGATLIVGAGRVGQLAAERLLGEPALGMRPIGFLDKDPLPRDAAARPQPGVSLPVLGASYDLEHVVREHAVENVLVAFSTAPSHVVLDIVRRCWALGVSVMVVPRLYEVEGRRTRTEHLGALPVVTLSPADPRSWQFDVKYALDRIVAGIALTLLVPLLGAVALTILMTTGRPIIFRQRRVGRDGHVFEMLKFRTMRGTPDIGGELDAEWASVAAGDGHAGAGAATADDRRTPFGRALRRLSIDELPQLWNVLRGDMSLVGPRPERVHYVELFEQAIYRYPDRHRVKSGLTGWAQVNGLRGETSLADRIEWDNFYIENWSAWLDLKIILKTLPALLAGRGAR